MQSKILIFLIPFLGLAAATHLANLDSIDGQLSGESSKALSANDTSYKCDECLTFLKQLKSSETIPKKLTAICNTVFRKFFPFPEAVCPVLVTKVSDFLSKLDENANCYAVGVCPSPAKPEDKADDKWDQADDCHLCAGVVRVAGDSMAARLPEYINRMDKITKVGYMFQASGWRLARELLRELLRNTEMEPIAVSRYLDAFSEHEIDAKHSLAYCYSINKCTQFPFHM